jgi:hypothetical protein
MGLPVVGRLASRLGIEIEFRSVLQHGTVVDLTVPGSLYVHHRAPALDDTRELTPVSAVAAISTPPRWPSPAGKKPITAAEPVIFQKMWRDPQRSWFLPSAGQPPTPLPRTRIEPVWQPAGTPPGAAGWEGPARPAVAAVAETTRSGLPVRQPGQRVVPVTEATTRRSIPVQRVPDEVRRQMSAMQDALGLAGPRTLHPMLKDGPR